MHMRKQNLRRGTKPKIPQSKRKKFRWREKIESITLREGERKYQNRNRKESKTREKRKQNKGRGDSTDTHGTLLNQILAYDLGNSWGLEGIP